MNAQQILRKSAQHIEDRAAARDQAEGERSMARTVAAFNALTGHKLSERDGWLFMVQLKAARATNTPTGIADDYEDMAAYAALAGECVAVNDNAPKPGEIMFIVKIDGRDVQLPRGHEWYAQDANGDWWSFDEHPVTSGDGWEANVSVKIAHSKPLRDWRMSLKSVYLK